MTGAIDDPLAASDPDVTAWVSANAGSGKTHTLADRVSRLLLAGADPAKILCLTYTKSAAAEMMHRLFEKRLGKWAMLDDKSLRSELAGIGAPALDASRLREARRLFARALETPGGLKIQTIHAFCQRLLSRFPLEAGISPGFSVITEQETRDLIAEARSRILNRAGAGEQPVGRAVSHLVTNSSEGQLKSILDAALGNDRRKLARFFETLPDGVDALSRAIHENHGTSPHETHEHIATAYCSAMESRKDKMLKLANWLDDGSTRDRERGEAIRNAVYTKNESEKFDAWCSALLKKDRTPYKDYVTRKLALANPEHFEYIQGLIDDLIATEERCRAAKAAAMAEAALVIADTVCREYDAEKRRLGLLDYNDLVVKTRDLLQTGEAAEWVLYKLDGGLEHILIDEAQDTSPEQWDIVKKLSDEFFTGRGREPFVLKTMFAVGDEKQSIFSFQGADPLHFGINRRHFELRAGEAQLPFSNVRLLKSRRSAPEILEFVDAVFSAPTAREGLTSKDDPISHEVFRKAARGRVELWPTVKPTQKVEPTSWMDAVDQRSSESPVIRLAKRVAEEIAQWTDGRKFFPGEESPVRPGDIMILLHRREPFASEVIRELKQRGVPVAGADRLKLQEQIGVMDILAMAKFAVLPEDDLTLATILRSPIFALSGDMLEELCVGREGTLWQEVTRRKYEAALAPVHELLSETLSRADQVPPYEFFAHLLMARGVLGKLVSRLGPEARDAIDEFLTLSLDFEAHASPSLQRFLHWFERGEATIKRDMEGGRDEVRVMTVHGAKGLEARIVILPDTTAAPGRAGSHGELLYTWDGVFYPTESAQTPNAVTQAKLSIDADIQAEHRRLLYVALTRARDTLVICGFENARKMSENSWYALCRNAMSQIGTPEGHGEETCLALGNAQLETRSLAAQVTGKTNGMPDWATQPAPRERARVRTIQPSDAASNADPPAFSPLGSSGMALQRGILIHALLAYLPEIEPDRRDVAARAFLARRKVAQAAAEEMVEAILAVTNASEFAHCFGPGTQAEAAIVAELPELGSGVRVNGRIDRLWVDERNVLAIDFKTNRPAPAGIEGVNELYLSQMALYRAALGRVFPGRRIACALLWTDGPCLMPLPDDHLEAELLKIRSRLASP